MHRDGWTISRIGVTPLVALLSLGQLLAFVDRAKVAGAMPAIRRQIAMTDTDAGMVIGTALALGYGATILLMAASRRSEDSAWSWRLPVGVGLWASASLATGLATSVGLLIAARLAVGCGQALFIPAALGWIVAEGDRVGARASALSRFTAAASLGRSVGLLAIGAALALVGAVGADAAAAWRWSFVLTAIPNIILLILVLRIRPHRMHDVRETGEAGVPAGPARPVYLLLAIMPIVLVQAFAGWTPTLFVRDRGVSPQVASVWLGTLTFVGGVGGQLVAGWLMARIREWRDSVPVVIVGSMAATLPGLALTGWGPDPASATIGVLLVNLPLGLATFSGLFGWQRLTPATGRVRSNGLFLAAVTAAGVGLGPLLTGIVADHGTALRSAMMATAILCIAAGAILALVAQPLYRKNDRAVDAASRGA